MIRERENMFIQLPHHLRQNVTKTDFDGAASEIEEMVNSMDVATAIDDSVVTTNGYQTDEIADNGRSNNSNNASVMPDGFGGFKSVSTSVSLAAIVMLLLLLCVLISHSIFSH